MYRGSCVRLLRFLTRAVGGRRLGSGSREARAMSLAGGPKTCPVPREANTAREANTERLVW
jgi:hypothetical protein